MREETLRALISARENLSNKMRDAAEGTRDLRQSMAETVASSASLAGMMDSTEEQTGEYENAIARLGRESVQAAAKQEFLARNVRNAGTKAWFASGALRAYTGSADEAGDESAEAAVQTAGLAAALKSVGVAAGEASVNVGPFNTSVRRAVVALPAIIGLMGSFVSVLGGVAAAAGAATGALTALLAGGLVGHLDKMVRHSSELETRGEALEEMFSRLASAIDEATQPLQQLQSQEGFLSLLSGIVSLMGDLSRSAARLQSVFGGVADRLSEVFWAEEARGIAAVENMITQLMPMLEALTFYILTELPDLFAWLTKETKRVGPAMGDFFTSLIPVARELTEIGNTIFRLTLPALSLLLDAVTYMLGVFNAIPDSLLVASIAFGVMSAALVTYSGSATMAAAATTALTAAASPLIGAVTAITSALSASVVAIAAVVAAVAGVITYFDLWDDIMRGIIFAWNMIVESIEFFINAFLGVKKVLTDFLGPAVYLIPVLGQIYLLMDLVSGVIDAMVWVFRKLGGVWKWLGKQYEKYIDPIIDKFIELIEKQDEAVDNAGGVDISGAKMETPSAAAEGGPSDDNPEDGNGDGGSEMGGGAQMGNSQVENRAEEINENRDEYNFDFSGSTFGGSQSERDIEKAVERALNKKQSTSSDT